MSEGLPSDVELTDPAADRMAVRRWQRARRAGILALLAFTGALWFAENYLRYDLNETKYISALSLPNESARAILRNAVKDEIKRHGKAVPMHLEALASIEEDDLVEARYQEAYALNPNSWELVLNYGTRLFLNGRIADARERFREAGVQDPNNALPRYLEAAALAVSDQQQSDLSEALAIVARTNVSKATVRFPRPLWHPSLPRRGDLYQGKQQIIVDRACAPIYRFKNLIEARVRAQGAEHAYQWDDWLETVQVMGERLLIAPEETGSVHLSQAVTGIQLQLDMLGLRVWLAETTGRAVPPNAEARAALLREALNRLGAFSEDRNTWASSARAQLLKPLRGVATSAMLLLALVAGALLLGRVTGLRQIGRDFVPPAGAVTVLLAALAGFTGLLGAYSVNAWYGGEADWTAVITVLWYAATALGVLAGALLPALYLPGSAVMPRYAAHAGSPTARRLGGYLNLAKRTWEDVLMALLASTCIWVILGRIVLGLYPTRLDLLVPGFEAECAALIREIIAMLTNPA